MNTTVIATAVVKKGIARVPRSKKPEQKSWLPEHEVEALGRWFLPMIREYYEADEGQKAFEEWKANRPSRNPEDEE